MPAQPLNVPVLGDQVPHRGNAFSNALAHLALRLTGWRFEGDFPNYPKFVLIVAPHTSNWDFPLGLMAMFALNLRTVFLGKHTLFRRPFGGIMRWLGGAPVDRTSAHNVVYQTIALIRTNEKLVLVVSPEGTRKKLPKWRTGFYYVAKGAGIPIVPIAFDYSTKTFRVFPPLVAGDDKEADFRVLHAYFDAKMARFPAQY
jgi:1-acyl-sn-glycerol-3-phosphate acyltransferase